MPKQIAKKLKITMSTLSYHLKTLKQNGSIEKIGYSVWKTNKYKEQKEVRKVRVGNPQVRVKNSNFFSKQNRGHAFRFTVKIPRLVNWENRVNYLKKKNIDFKLINNGHTHRIIFRDCKVWLNSKSIVVYFPSSLSFFGESAKHSEERAVFEMIEIMRGLDNLFNTSFKINRAYQIKVFGKHHSNVRNSLAKLYNDSNRKLTVFNERGAWLLIDDSFDLDELETIGCNEVNDATSDMDDVVAPFFNKLKSNPFTSDNIVDLQKKVGLLMGDYVETVKVFDSRMSWMAENNRSHQKVLEDMAVAINELRKEIAKGRLL